MPENEALNENTNAEPNENTNPETAPATEPPVTPEPPTPAEIKALGRRQSLPLLHRRRRQSHVSRGSPGEL